MCRRSARAVGASIAAACLLLLAGCSGNDSSTATGPKRSTTTTTKAAASAGSGSGSNQTTAPSAAGGSADTGDSTSAADAAKPHGNIRTAAPKVKDPGILAPVALDRTADFGNGVTVRLASMEPVTAEAKIPGETSGPAVRVTVAITNGSGSAISLDNVSAILDDAAGATAARVTNPADVAFSGQLAAGATGEGVYVFTIPVADRDGARLTVKYSQGAPTASFTGSLPNA